jgi:putative ABC transport system permease protein
MKLRWLRTLRLAVKNLQRHKLRSGLTALGVVFGVCSVIAMLAIGEGASRQAQREIERLGSTNIVVHSVKPVLGSSTESQDGSILEYGLTNADFTRITSTVPTLQEALPTWELRKEVRQRAHRLIGRIVATTPAYQRINGLILESGRFLSDTDVQRLEKVAVLAGEAARALFPLEDPLGKSVRVQDDYYRVVGVCKPRAATAAVGNSLPAQEYDKDVYLPLSTARLRFGELQVDPRASQLSHEKVELSRFVLVVGRADQVRPTAAVVRGLLARHHRQNDYGVIVPLELLEQAERTKRLFNAVLGAIGAISLLIGGIGIMNIMLAAVTERTREIGIRRALGARRSDIIAQFLLEAVVLSGVGGLLGLALGVGLAYPLEESSRLAGFALPDEVSFLGGPLPVRWVIAAGAGAVLGLVGLVVFLQRLRRQGLTPLVFVEGVALCLGAGLTGLVLGVGLPHLIADFVGRFFDYSLPTAINSWSLPLAFGISLAVGIVFGLYPARRAALMDPIEALRHE